MENTFKSTVRLKVDKVNNLCHLSIRSSEYKVEVFKIPLGEMSSLLSQFKEGMRADGPIDIEPIQEETNND